MLNCAGTSIGFGIVSRKRVSRQIVCQAHEGAVTKEAVGISSRMLIVQIDGDVWRRSSIDILMQIVQINHSAKIGLHRYYSFSSLSRSHSHSMEEALNHMNIMRCWPIQFRAHIVLTSKWILEELWDDYEIHAT